MNENDYTQSVGTYISSLRMSAGLSQNEFSKRSGVSRTTLHEIEKGNRLPSTKDLLSVCRTLNVTPNDVLAFGENQNTIFNQKSDNNEQLRNDLRLLAKTFLSFMRVGRQTKKSISDIAFACASSELGLSFVSEIEDVNRVIDEFLTNDESKQIVLDMVKKSGDDFVNIEDSFIFLINFIMNPARAAKKS